jgi:tetratricopeptide (TPR) repeat protein
MSPRTTRILAVAIALAVSALAPAPALAEEAAAPDPREQAREHARQGRLQYQLGRFDQALEEYAAAYELDPVPALLFNIGQCHRQLGDHERAIFFYEGFLRDSPDAPNRATVESLLAESRAELARQRAAAEATATPPDAGATTPAAEPEQPDASQAEPEPAAAAGPVATTRDADTRPVYRRWWFWTIIGVALAATATGVGVGVATSSSEDPTGTLGMVDWR